MMTFRVLPIPPAISNAVRENLTSPQYGHPAHVEVAAGYGPCRSCLQTFRVGQDKRILFTYNPFDGIASFPAPGPVFIHSETCTPFGGAGLPSLIRALPLVIEGFGPRRQLVAQEFVEDRVPEAVLANVLSDRRVLYAHIRNAEAGCFIAHVEARGSTYSLPQ